MYGSVQNGGDGWGTKEADHPMHTSEKNKMKTTILATLAGAMLVASALAAAATPEAKALYKQSNDKAELDYKAARARCDVITGNPMDVCVAEAKAGRVQAEQSAYALYKNTLKAYTTARMKIADAYFDLDKAKCNGLTGNQKDVCVQRAKATLIAARSDAKADRKTIEARADARDDKRDAEYNVAREKCDAFAGDVKDGCVASAKAQFGK